MVTNIIYTLYDNISFIKQSTFNGKPLLIIYFDSDDTAANIESWFDEKISRDIEEWTSGNIVVCPDWIFNWDSRKKNADVFINTELIKYDNLGNVVNESVLSEETEIPLFVRRRFTLEELEWLVNDVKEMIDDGESLDTAIYDGVREFIKSKNFSDIDEFGLDADYWSSYLNYERPLVRYVKNKLNIRESILEERNSTMRRIFRRADAEKIDEIFNGGLKTMMERYLQNKHNWRLMNFNKFKTSVIQYVIVDLCVNYSDICYGSVDFHNQVSEFLLNHYSDKIEQKWEEINSGDINESVLKEELSARVRRRVSAIDWQIGFAVKEVARQRTNICNMGESGYIETVIEKTIDSMYWDFFSDMDDNSDEWTSAYHYMERYINNNFVNKLRENYHLNCGD